MQWNYPRKNGKLGRAMVAEKTPTVPATPYGWHNELVHDASGEVIKGVFDRSVKLEGPDELTGYTWRATALYTSWTTTGAQTL